MPRSTAALDIVPKREAKVHALGLYWNDGLDALLRPLGAEGIGVIGWSVIRPERHDHPGFHWNRTWVVALDTRPAHA